MSRRDAAPFWKPSHWFPAASCGVFLNLAFLHFARMIKGIKTFKGSQARRAVPVFSGNRMRPKGLGGDGESS